MTPEAALAAARANHIPVLCDEVVAAIAPRDGDLIVDGTFGAGGYTRRLLEAADCRVIGIDRDPDALEIARYWAPLYDGRLELVQGVFGELDTLIGSHVPDAVVLDIGVSSMQIDQSERGFSFMRDGALDMRMEQSGTSAADIVNSAGVEELADILFQYGEERRSRAIAQAIVAARKAAPIETTLRLAEVIEAVAPRKKPGQPHPATRAFQALRIFVNDELGELVRGLAAAERALRAPGGKLAVVTFHSLEDRVVKRFFKSRSEATGAGVSRHSPGPIDTTAPSLKTLTRKSILPGDAEIAANPRARSSALRVAERTENAAHDFDARGLGLPGLALKGARG